jgi:hypothetical protein
LMPSSFACWLISSSNRSLKKTFTRAITLSIITSHKEYVVNMELCIRSHRQLSNPRLKPKDSRFVDWQSTRDSVFPGKAEIRALSSSTVKTGVHPHSL